MTRDRHEASPPAAQRLEIVRLSLPTGSPGSELSTILESCNNRLRELQAQAADVVLAELATVQAAWLRAVTTTADLAPGEANREHAARLIQIVSAWFRTIAQTQSALIDLIGRSALVSTPVVAPRRPEASTPLSDRRRQATIINFPDRRRIQAA